MNFIQHSGTVTGDDAAKVTSFIQLDIHAMRAFGPSEMGCIDAPESIPCGSTVGVVGFHAPHGFIPTQQFQRTISR